MSEIQSERQNAPTRKFLAFRQKESDISGKILTRLDGDSFQSISFHQTEQRESQSRTERESKNIFLFYQGQFLFVLTLSKLTP